MPTMALSSRRAATLDPSWPVSNPLAAISCSWWIKSDANSGFSMFTLSKSAFTTFKATMHPLLFGHFRRRCGSGTEIICAASEPIGTGFRATALIPSSLDKTRLRHARPVGGAGWRLPSFTFQEIYEVLDIPPVRQSSDNAKNPESRPIVQTRRRVGISGASQGVLPRSRRQVNKRMNGCPGRPGHYAEILSIHTTNLPPLFSNCLKKEGGTGGTTQSLSLSMTNDNTKSAFITDPQAGGTY